MQTRKFLVVLGTAAVIALPISSFAQSASDADKALREALRKQVDDYRTNPETPTPPAAPTPTPAPTPKVETVVVPIPEEPAPAPPAVVTNSTAKAASGPVFSEVPDETTAKSQDAMAEALRKQLAAEKAAKAAAPAAATTTASNAPKPATSTQSAAPVTPSSPAANQSGSILAGLEAPPAPINATKQQQLEDLLARYKLDQISPQQYQVERAKIMAN